MNLKYKMVGSGWVFFRPVLHLVSGAAATCCSPAAFCRVSWRRFNFAESGGLLWFCWLWTPSCSGWERLSWCSIRAKSTGAIVPWLENATPPWASAPRCSASYCGPFARGNSYASIISFGTYGRNWAVRTNIEWPWIPTSPFAVPAQH